MIPAGHVSYVSGSLAKVRKLAKRCCFQGVDRTLISANPSSNLAIFLDYENVVKQEGHRLQDFLNEACASCTVVMRRAYANWQRFASHRGRLQAEGFELIDLPSIASGKNAADIKLAVDAIEVAFTKPFIESFVIVSGDTDFLPLVIKLNELNRRTWLYTAERHNCELLSKFTHSLVLASEVPKPASKAELKPNVQRAATKVFPSKPTMAATSIPSNRASIRDRIAYEVELHRSQKRTLEREILKLVEMALHVCQHCVAGPFAMHLLFVAMKALDPAFDIARFSDGKKKRYIKFACKLKSLQLIDLTYDNGIRAYSITVNKRSPPPACLNTSSNFQAAIEAVSKLCMKDYKTSLAECPAQTFESEPKQLQFAFD